MTPQQHHARATDTVLAVIARFLQDDAKEIKNFTDDLVREALWNATEAARHARELLKRRALGQELSPLGYYLRDEDLPDQVDITRIPGGGILVDPDLAQPQRLYVPRFPCE